MKKAKEQSHKENNFSHTRSQRNALLFVRVHDACGGPAKPKIAHFVGVGAKKKQTDIPAAITTSDSVDTRLGTLKFTDGFPDDATGFG